MSDRSTLFADIDSREPERFAQHLAPNVVMRFGNADPVNGREAVRDAWAQFCDGLDGVRHELVDTFEKGDRTVVEARVTYTRKDNREVTVPVVTIYRAPAGLIDDYRIYIDVAPVFAD
jgi:ketosteroid isomerase-like protein